MNNKIESPINELLRNLGISYEEFNNLEFEHQQEIIKEYCKKYHKNTFKDKNVHVMIGNGEHSIFTKVEKGKKIMIGSGKHSCFIEAGLTLEEARCRLDNKIDDILYPKTKKIVKRR